ncbi:L-lactate dehydrogenase complex protein LldG [Propionibacterium cyclohexanicum]|uniref:L-lactate dehydrogenase complex protein LldG n=1 Tax=Propionibacterium cyclohexanicum TaxID=64702 RepID=A0A1H9SWB2_9ACTN|nr:LUD domain-containing protein [Propionibacterium cyclohexanicum]SER89186.1 L-lactate dehydrogenase complex protein LldG [Propionibacterium cyclohexanicum]
MDAKQEVLARIRQATTDITEKDPLVDTPVTWTYGGGIEMDDVVGTFQEKVEDYQATVVRAAHADLPTAVVDGLKATGAAESVVVPVGLDKDWVKAIESAGLTVHVDDPQLSNAQLDKTDAVVTAAAVGVADTGTIVLDHEDDQGRRALSLVPDRHVCVIRTDQIVSDVPEAVQRVKQAVHAGRPLTWISGGSATSDIELSRVDGVHGPRKLYVIIAED